MGVNISSEGNDDQRNKLEYRKPRYFICKTVRTVPRGLAIFKVRPQKKNKPVSPTTVCMSSDKSKNIFLAPNNLIVNEESHAVLKFDSIM